MSQNMIFVVIVATNIGFVAGLTFGTIRTNRSWRIFTEKLLRENGLIR